MNCLQAHVAASARQVGEVGVVGYWVWRGLVVLLPEELSEGQIEKEQWVHVCL